jgi:dihydrofolate reductase
MASASFTAIVAATRSNGIGKGGTLPWRLPKEMAYFAQVTSRAPEGAVNAVVMGRNTWESIPAKFRPLRRRMNVVISSNKSYEVFVTSLQANVGMRLKVTSSKQVEGVPTVLSSSVEEAVRTASSSDSSTNKLHRTFLIGGAALYNECLQLSSDTPGHVDRVLLTRVLQPAFEECDVFLADFVGSGGWERAEHKVLEEWVGIEVPHGVQEENGIQYEFQMWTRT